MAERNVGMRADSRTTRVRLLSAVGRLLDHGHPDVTLTTVAEEAGVSTATAYRYFASADDAVFAYVLQFPDEVATRCGDGADRAGGLERLAEWSRVWIELTDDGWGASLVQLRSTEGFLARRAAGEAVIAAVCRHLEPPVRDALVELELPEDLVEIALFLWNAIYDPREILDLRQTLAWTRTRIEQGMWTMYLGALRGYADSAPPKRRRAPGRRPAPQART
jgi:AcrR family transcriptional regulator